MNFGERCRIKGYEINTASEQNVAKEIRKRLGTESALGFHSVTSPNSFLLLKARTSTPACMQIKSLFAGKINRISEISWEKLSSEVSSVEQ